MVLRNSNRLLKLINQVLDLRTFEKDFNQLNVERFDVYEFIAERSMFFAEEAKNKNIKFDINIPKDKQEIEADPDMLDNIVLIYYQMHSNIRLKIVKYLLPLHNKGLIIRINSLIS